jgi:phytoene desaturase
VVSNADAGHTYDRLLRNHARKRWTARAAETVALVDGPVRLVLRHQGHARHVARRGHHTILNGPRYKGLSRTSSSRASWPMT